MKPKWLATVCLALMIAAIGSAQSYFIRVEHNTNLRKTYSLESLVLESARAGSVLEVSGAFGKWLKISRPSRDMWMAGWVDHERVDSPPAASQDIDNCCFVDRQCNNDQEWTDGYWAFQNNQCPAPPPPQTSNAAVPDGADEINNCCFLDWNCQNDDDWERGYFAFQSNSCDAGPVILSGIKVEGSKSFIAYVGRGLNLLRTRAPHWYQYTISGLNAVIEVNPPWGGSGVNVVTAVATFNHNPNVIFVPEDDMTMAEFLLHEACHVHRYRAGQEPGGYPGEKACIQAEVALWAELAPGSEHHNRKLRYLANIHRRECQHWLPPVPGGCPYW